MLCGRLALLAPPSRLVLSAAILTAVAAQAVPGEQSPEQRSSQPTDSNTPVANGTRVSSPALAFLGRIDLNRPLSRKPAAGIDSYVEGLDALANGQFVQAVSHLSRAVEANDEAAAYYTARGVAYMLLEKLEEAQADLRKSLLLRPGDQETQAWVGAAQRMTGDMRAIRSFLGSSNPFEQALGTISVEYGKGRNTGPAGNSRPGEAPRMIAAARAKFPWLGSLFAERRKSAPELTPFLYALARSQYARHEYAAALAQLERVLSLRPGDLAVLYYHAACLVELGDNAKAREELTRVLIGQTDFADAYLRRALACARLGATRRTTADLETAKRLGATDLDSYTARIDREIDALKSNLGGPPAMAPQAISQALEQAVRAGKPWQEVVGTAMALNQAMNDCRLRGDETYQDGLRAREDAVRARPNDPEALVELASFLFKESTVRGEKLGPRAEDRKYRYQTEAMKEAELARAERLFDVVLAANPNHVKALTGKAGVRFEDMQYNDAERLLKRAMALRPDDPDVLARFADVMQIASFQKRVQAADLRTIKHWSDARYYYTRWPSQTELEQAGQLETQSAELVRLAWQEMGQAARALQGTAKGFWYEGQIAWNDGRLDAARAAFEKAVRLKPDYLEAQANLTGVYSQLGMADETRLQCSIVANLVQTTAAHLLEPAWDLIPKTAFRSARAWLERARAADPADARAPAYLGVIAAMERNRDEAVVYYRMALAIEEAQNATTAAGSNGTDTRRLDPLDFGLAIVIRNRLGKLLLSQGRLDDARQVVAANIALQPRLLKAGRSMPVWTAMLPDMRSPTDPNHVPEAPKLGTLLAWSSIQDGNALLGLKQADEAERSFLAAVCLSDGEAGARARIALCRMAMARGDLQTAFERLQSGSTTGPLPAAVRTDINKLNLYLAHELNQRGPARSFRGPTLRQADIREQYERRLDEQRRHEEDASHTQFAR